MQLGTIIIAVCDRLSLARFVLVDVVTSLGLLILCIVGVIIRTSDQIFIFSIFVQEFDLQFSNLVAGMS
jgi:preprotein translocase subunit Sss1